MRSDEIQPLSEVRPHLTQHLRRVRETHRPLFITCNGRTAGVLLSPQDYDELVEKAERAEISASIRRSLDDVKAGHVQDARQAMREIAAEKGLKLDR
jgi:prevent-host-death family protein